MTKHFFSDLFIAPFLLFFLCSSKDYSSFDFVELTSFGSFAPPKVLLFFLCSSKERTKERAPETTT
jgi:hypothetical protein